MDNATVRLRCCKYAVNITVWWVTLTFHWLIRKINNTKTNELKALPLQHGAIGGGWCDDIAIRSAITLVKVGTADIVYRGGREVLWWLLRPTKLLFGFSIDLDWIQHGDSSRVNRCSNWHDIGSQNSILIWTIPSLVQKKKIKNPHPINMSNHTQIRREISATYWKLTTSCQPVAPLPGWRGSQTSVPL